MNLSKAIKSFAALTPLFIAVGCGPETPEVLKKGRQSTTLTQVPKVSEILRKEAAQFNIDVRFVEVAHWKGGNSGSIGYELVLKEKVSVPMEAKDPYKTKHIVQVPHNQETRILKLTYSNGDGRERETMNLDFDNKVIADLEKNKPAVMNWVKRFMAEQNKAVGAAPFLSAAPEPKPN